MTVNSNSIKVGDLVVFRPSVGAGNLTAVKYMARMERRFDRAPGLVIRVMPTAGSTNVVVQVGEDCIVINRRYLEVINA